ncbi:MAG: hypothetical protein U9Q81_18825 [Pseudomonadota bacterium]|nr:hypothetical protein [Pseudomonadota bacterium]
MLALFEAKWREVVAEESAKDPAFEQIWSSLQRFREEYRVWNELAFLPRPGTRRISAKTESK